MEKAVLLLFLALTKVHLVYDEILKVSKMKKKRMKLFSILVTAIIVIMFILFFPFKIPFYVKVPGKVIPHFEWLVIKSQDNQLFSILSDHLNEVVQQYTSIQFDRGDITNFKLNSSISSKGFVSSGDTVGVVYSSELEYMLSKLEGELSIAKATLKLYEAGEKESIITEAQRKLAHERERVNEQRSIVNRLRELRDQNLISKEEFEIASNKLELYDIKVDIAEARLQTVTTGAQQELIDTQLAKIKSIENEILSIYGRIRQLVLITPLNGAIQWFFNSDTLVSVQDTSSYVVIMPVKWKDHYFIDKDQEVRIKVPGMSDQLHGTVYKTSNVVQILNNRQIVVVTAVIGSSSQDFISGTLAGCTIKCQPVSIPEYFKRIF